MNEMTHIDWWEFLNLLPFTLVGLVVHFLRQLNRAKKRDDYTHACFFKKNGFGYIIALLTSLLALAWLSAGLEKMTFQKAVFGAISIGISGGTIFRKLGGSSE
jgi:uncharacterized membrane protein YfhO